MNLYNMAVGHDPGMEYVLFFLDIISQGEMEQIPRFRDAYIDPEGEPSLVILTRSGGPNRESREVENEAMRQRPGFVRDFDDDFDPTFAHFVYQVPPQWQPHIHGVIKELRALGWDFPKPMERLKRATEGEKT